MSLWVSEWVEEGERSSGRSVASCGGNEGALWTEKCEGLRLPAYISIHQPIQLRRLVRARATIRLTTRNERDRATGGKEQERKKEKEGKGDSVDKGTNGINPTN